MTTAERIATALERIANVLDQVDQPLPNPGPVACTHPIEARTDFGVTNGADDWQCDVCGFRTVT